MFFLFLHFSSSGSNDIIIPGVIGNHVYEVEPSRKLIINLVATSLIVFYNPSSFSITTYGSTFDSKHPAGFYRTDMDVTILHYSSSNQSLYFSILSNQAIPSNISCSSYSIVIGSAYKYYISAPDSVNTEMKDYDYGNGQNHCIWFTSPVNMKVLTNSNLDIINHPNDFFMTSVYSLSTWEFSSKSSSANPNQQLVGNLFLGYWSTDTQTIQSGKYATMESSSENTYPSGMVKGKIKGVSTITNGVLELIPDPTPEPGSNTMTIILYSLGGVTALGLIASCIYFMTKSPNDTVWD